MKLKKLSKEQKLYLKKVKDAGFRIAYDGMTFTV